MDSLHSQAENLKSKRFEGQHVRLTDGHTDTEVSVW